MADAFKWGKDLKCKIDNNSGSLTDISDETNSQALQTAFDIFDTHGVGSSAPEKQMGLPNLTIPLNGWVNGTTEGIWGPLVGTRTSVTKTFALYNGIKWYTGEAVPSSVDMSGDPSSLQTWSCSLGQSGAVTRTSVEPS